MRDPRRRGGLVAGMLAGTLASAGCQTRATHEAAEPVVIAGAVTPTRTLAATPDLLALGRRTYEKECAACHGAAGDGEGEGAYLLYPRPRDFTTGEFRLVSTWEGVPTDEDLFAAISRGMPGSAMPPWSHLSEEALWGLVHFIKTFSRHPLDVSPAREPDAFGSGGAGVIQLPPEPPFDAAAQVRAGELYARGCAPCHGPTGRGDGQQEQIDSKGFPTRPRDLTGGVFKGRPEPEELYRRLVAGLPGSPMPQSGYLHGDDAWHLVHFVRSLSTDAQRARVELKRFRLVASRVETLPEHPDSGVWRLAPPARLGLMPLWWRDERPEEVTVQALHDGRTVALRLSWADGTPDATVIRPQDFRDAAAVQFALTPDPPFFAMGAAGGAVNIWMWKADRQADLAQGFHDLTRQYPHVTTDWYPDLLRPPQDQPIRHAPTPEADPRFITAWGAGNVVTDPAGESAAEDLRAEGFGTLRARPAADDRVEAIGTYDIAGYRVQFTRAFRGSGRDAVSLAVGRPAAVAFAVWDGHAGDNDGKKSVTIWHELVLAR